MTIVHRLAAFTQDPVGGNPAGVVIGSTHPSDEEMQRIAAEIGYSETAFLAPAEGTPGSRWLVAPAPAGSSSSPRRDSSRWTSAATAPGTFSPRSPPATVG